MTTQSPACIIALDSNDRILGHADVQVTTPTSASVEYTVIFSRGSGTGVWASLVAAQDDLTIMYIDKCEDLSNFDDTACPDRTVAPDSGTYHNGGASLSSTGTGTVLYQSKPFTIDEKFYSVANQQHSYLVLWLYGAEDTYQIELLDAATQSNGYSWSIAVPKDTWTMFYGKLMGPDRVIGDGASLSDPVVLRITNSNGADIHVDNVHVLLDVYTVLDRYTETAGYDKQPNEARSVFWRYNIAEVD